MMTTVTPPATALRTPPRISSPDPVDLDVEAALDRVLDDPKAVFRLKVLRAARRLIAQQGLDVSIDLIADAAGVNRRTLFRHIESRDALIADALSSAMDRTHAEIVAVVPPDQPLHQWIADLARQIMEIHIAAGRGYWQLAATPDDELSPELVVINRRRRAHREATTTSTAEAIWERGGGEGPCPPVISDAVGVAISAFTTRAMVHDLRRDVPELADNLATMLTTLVEAQAAAGRRTPRPDARPTAKRASRRTS